MSTSSESSFSAVSHTSISRKKRIEELRQERAEKKVAALPSDPAPSKWIKAKKVPSDDEASVKAPIPFELPLTASTLELERINEERPRQNTYLQKSNEIRENMLKDEPIDIPIQIVPEIRPVFDYNSSKDFMSAVNANELSRETEHISGSSGGEGEGLDWLKALEKSTLASTDKMLKRSFVIPAVAGDGSFEEFSSEVISKIEEIAERVDVHGDNFSESFNDTGDLGTGLLSKAEEYSDSFESLTDLRDQKLSLVEQEVSKVILKSEDNSSDSVSSVLIDQQSIQPVDKIVSQNLPPSTISKSLELSPIQGQLRPETILIVKEASNVAPFDPPAEIEIHDTVVHPLIQANREHSIISVSSRQVLEAKSFLSFSDMLKANEEPIIISPKASDLHSSSSSVSLKKAALQKTNAKRPKPVPKKVVGGPVTSLPATKLASSTKVATPTKLASPTKKAKVLFERKSTITSNAPKAPTSIPVSSKINAISNLAPLSDVSAALLRTELDLLMKENSSLLEKNKTLSSNLARAESDTHNLRHESLSKDAEIVSLQQQNRFTETLLQDERMKLPTPLNDSGEFQKKLDDQEFLIRGYQTENEKLLLQSKELRKSTKELEQRHFLKIESIQKESANLKMQKEVNGDGGRGTMSNAKDFLTIEQLKGQVSSLQYDLETNREDSSSQIMKYEALLADSRRSLEDITQAQPEHLKKQAREFETKRIEYDKYIVELETKLEWHLENQDIFTQVQHRIERYEQTIKDLNKALDKQPSSGKIARSSNDIRKIKQLENQLLDLQEQENVGPDLKQVMESNRPSIPIQQMVTYLKKIIQNQDHDLKKIRQDYELKIKELTDEVVEIIKPRKASFQEVEPVGRQPPTLANDIDHSDAFDRALKLQARLKKRILELESQLMEERCETSKENRILKNNYERKIGEKDELIAVLGEIGPAVEIESPDNRVRIEKLKAELDDSLVRNDLLKARLEASERTQVVMQNSALELLKTSQKETSLLAFEHSRHSLELLRTELRQEQKVQSAALIESYKHRILELERTIEEERLEPHNIDLRDREDRAVRVQGELDEISITHSRCEERFRRLREEVSPSLAELDRLSSRIQEMETSARNQVSRMKEKLGSSYQNSQNYEIQREVRKFRRENDTLVGQVRLKDVQIRAFQKEVDELIIGISNLRKPTSSNTNDKQ